MRRTFTPDQEAEILQMRAIGIPTGDIIAEFGHRNSIYSVFRRAGVAGGLTGGAVERRLSPADRQEILRLWGAGLSRTAISRKVERSFELVARVLREFGVDVESQPPPDVQCNDCGSTNVTVIQRERE